MIATKQTFHDLKNFRGGHKIVCYLRTHSGLIHIYLPSFYVSYIKHTFERDVKRTYTHTHV